MTETKKTEKKKDEVKLKTYSFPKDGFAIKAASYEEALIEAEKLKAKSA